MSKTVHTTGPDQRNQQGQDLPAVSDADVERGDGEDASSGGRPDCVSTSDLGARGGATTRVDMTQADNENAGEAWMEVEERAAAGATRGRR